MRCPSHIIIHDEETRKILRRVFHYTLADEIWLKMAEMRFITWPGGVVSMKKIRDAKNISSSRVLKSVLNGMNTFMYASDIQTDEIIFISDRMKEYFNLDDKAIGSICWKTLHSGLEKRCESCPIDAMVNNHETTVVLEQYDAATERYYKHTDCIIEWFDGKKVHLRHSTDITDIRLTEASLKKRLEQQELMSAISQSFTTTQDIHHLIGEALKMAGTFMRVNQAFLSKYQKDDGVLECLYEWYDDEGQPYIGRESKWPISPDMELYKDLMVNGYTAVSDYSMLAHPNFTVVKNYDLRAFLNIPVAVSGEFWGIIGFIINKRKYDWNESDIHLGKLIAGVFSGVVSRAIAEKNLLKTKEAAEQASRAKGDFLSRMSHEMRTPMNAIIGMTGIARNSENVQKMKYCLEKIDNASGHLLGLINDILDISKIEANKLELASVEFDFERMLMNIAGVVNFRIEEKNQNLIVNIDKAIPSAFWSDEMRLSQVIVNLLSNSAKFTPEKGTIILNVRALGLSDGTMTVLFEITDNGIGIAKEQQDRLFSPFEQADGNIAQNYGGTGLGLSISKRIVELMGGRIWVESALGQGSKFSFTVKMKSGNGLPRPELDRTINKEDVHILVVEQTPEIREYFMRVMPELGLSCDVADTESTALELIRQRKNKPYTVFFVNWSMSDSSNAKLIKTIRSANRGGAVNIMISETEWNKTGKDMAAAGDIRFVFKPLFPSSLINAVNESMGVTTERKKTRDKTLGYNFKDYALLVAEDIEINREIISAALEHTRVSIDFAQNGAQALSMFENNSDRYNLILMDIQMPEMDGYQATQKIRASNEAKAGIIPIIAMTANVFSEDVTRCMEAGMNDHIGKPINIEELLSKIDRFLHPELAGEESIGGAS